jgi:predicted ester cyclase
VHVIDSNGEWTTFEQIKSALWSQWKTGTKLTVTVHRGEQMVDVPITRDRVEGHEVPLSVFLDGWRHYLLNEMPDMHTEIDLLIEEGDLVAYYTTTTGTSVEYGQAAVWAESVLTRLRDGKIVEMWGVEDGLRQMLQLGFRLVEPVKKTA